MKNSEVFFIDLIQVSLGNQKQLRVCPSEEEWKEILAIAKKQAVAGILIDGIEKIREKGVKPPTYILLQWIGIEQRIEAQNKVVNQRCKELTELFASHGFKTCILKGQGNARMYPKPELRTSGDIDIWVDGTREDIHNFIVSQFPDTQDGDMHIDFPVFDNVAVEVHYKPSFDIRPKYEKRLQEWFGDYAEEQFNNKIDFEDGLVCFPTLEFNTVHQMAHIMNHFFVEGIGMRHFVDYYYVLCSVHDSGLKNNDFTDLFRWLGLEKFARGVMWIEKEILAIDEQCIILEPDERIGKLILKEMMEGGNFGHYDERYKGRRKGLLARGLTDTYRLLKLMPYFPGLALWKIWNKIENQRWKL